MSLILTLLCGLVATYLVQHFLQVRSRQRRLRRLGAATPVTLKSRWPWGINGVFWTMTFKGDFLDDFVCLGVRRVGLTFARDCFLGRPRLFTADAINMQAVLSTNFADWGMGERRVKQFGPFLGRGTVNSDGAEWKHARALVRPPLMRSEISDLRASERHFTHLRSCLEMETDGWTAFTEVGPLLFRYMHDQASELLFGESPESQTVGNHLHNGLRHDGILAKHSPREFEVAFDEASKGVSLRVRLGAFYWLVNYPSFRNAVRVCDSYAYHYVDKALELRKHAPTDGLEKAQFIQGLAESSLDRKSIRDQLLQLLFGGRDTTAALVSFSLLMLVRNQEAWARLRGDIVTMFGTVDVPGEEITFSSLKACKYLQYVLLETLRLFPSVPLGTRIALRDTVLPRGGGADGSEPIGVTQGTTIIFSSYVMHRQTDLWGPDAAEWKPERWIKRKFGPEYTPFSAGPRICPGQQLAFTQAGFVLVRLAQCYDQIEAKDASGPVRKRMGATISDADNVVMRFHQAPTAASPA